MAQCAVVGCKKDSSHDCDMSYYRFPAITSRYGWEEYELRKKRWADFVAAVQRKHASNEATDSFRSISSAAELYDVTNPNWLPTLYLGCREEGNVT